jgi:tRNA 2-thiouridine synthesizing protein A
MAGELDLLGVACPSNYVRVRLALEVLDPGDELEVLLDDGEPIRNVPRSLRDDGDKVLAIQPEDGHYRLRVRKGEPADAW